MEGRKVEMGAMDIPLAPGRDNSLYSCTFLVLVAPVGRENPFEFVSY
jgi:hypothetical protein